MAYRDDIYSNPERAKFEEKANKRYKAAIEASRSIPLSSLTVGDLLDILNMDGSRYQHSGTDTFSWRDNVAKCLEPIIEKYKA